MPGETVSLTRGQGFDLLAVLDDARAALADTDLLGLLLLIEDAIGLLAWKLFPEGPRGR